ncbi:MAG TPA: glutamate-cysteine ligase family protein, partial [Gaiellaceae bacterium]|nr:glutamate-cysteine ligase family protein [Gaiellaceae bacterium]
MKQAWPESITGVEGARPAGSVLDHRFGEGEPYTLGVEEEYMLLDGDSFDLVQRVDTILAAFVGHEAEAQMKPELMQSTLEVATPVCRTAGEADHALRRLRSAVRDIATANGLRLGSAGTHPFSLFERQRIT